jgi:AraC-like DNA-binding protein
VIYQNENFGNEYDYRCRWHDEFVVNAHLHDYSELAVCKKGKCELAVRGKRYVLEENEMIFIPPNCVHEYFCKDSEIVCAVFSNDYIPLFFRELAGRSIISSPIDVSDMTSITDRLLTLVDETPIAISGCLNLICEKVLQVSSFEDRDVLDGALYQKVITYISEHYQENITLKGIAQMFGYNEKYLSASLHALTGINFRSLVSMYRVSHAKRLLESGNYNMTEVALLSGFSAVNSFNRVFKLTVGKTPLEYKKGE